jgi:hypothetical protein
VTSYVPRSPLLVSSYLVVGIFRSNNVDAVKNSDIVVVCVKPKHLKDVLVELKPALEPRHLLVSVVTGISINEMTAIIGTASWLRFSRQLFGIQLLTDDCQVIFPCAAPCPTPPSLFKVLSVGRLLESHAAQSR